MSATAPTPAHPVRVFDIAVRQVQDMTAHFRRITFSGPALNRFGVPGPTLDLRIKLVLPVPGHPPARPGTPDGQLHDGWYQDWLRGEQPGRGLLRSYTVRALRTTPTGRELDVDFVIHPGHGGHGAPASDWARAAVPGTSAVIIGPDAEAITAATSRTETGIRWDPHSARDVLLAGDETAVPAISAILESLPTDVTGQAFLEVPDGGDFQDINTRSEVRITWLARNPPRALRGELLYEAVRSAVEPSDLSAEHHHGSHRVPAKHQNFPSSKEHPGKPAHQVDPSRTVSATELYAWVAAEANTVKNLRRYLVDQVGLDPKRSEFRGYWSLGKAGSGINGTPTVQAPRRSPRLNHDDCAVL